LGLKKIIPLSPAPVHDDPELEGKLFQEYIQKIFSPYYSQSLIGKEIEKFKNYKNLAKFIKKYAIFTIFIAVFIIILLK